MMHGWHWSWPDAQKLRIAPDGLADTSRCHSGPKRCPDETASGVAFPKSMPLQLLPSVVLGRDVKVRADVHPSSYKVTGD